MPTVITPVDTWPAAISTYADGEAIDQSNFETYAQEPTDALTYLRNRTPAAVAGNYPIPIAPVGLYQAGWTARWGFDIATEGWVNFSMAGADEMLIMFPALMPCSFSSVSMVIAGDPRGIGPHAAPPGTMPKIELLKFDASGATYMTAVGNQVDTSASAAAYDALHTVTYTPGAAQTIDHLTQYGISIRGESGANAQNNFLFLFGAYMTIVPV